MSTIHDVLAGLDFDDQISDSELVADAVVLLRLVRADDGQESVWITTNKGCGAMVEVGMLANALAIVNRSQADD